ncbi:SDR family NAD(P)-dependent oxidoreductase [Rhodococcoides corynebacterioides]|uniref:SDR family oxidoreductase n=1 Tax=Rhodococcoides corynebacterioides TaxID=53972 RepID=A0ABS7NYT6_9NOCA|nr:SDR family oxidoreductase [Rhodococcus corynebacterioides]MBY6365240.1 SDR family oxidoreductase [Rhodococcus corynebacterioides]MBY6406652.1 SDR family oxidoreductase [Rhodococcus corynebacterioides]
MTRAALITGGSRGIGLAVARRLASQGWSVLLTGRRQDTLDEAANTVRGDGAAEVRTVACDMAAPDVADVLVREFAQLSSTMDALVLNAGVGTAGPIESYPATRFDKTVDVNLRAPFRILQASMRLLRSAAEADPARGAKVIALASLAGVYPEAGLAAYGATKAALLSLIDTLNAEESGSGITGTAIAPGYVDTDMSAWIADRIPPDTMIAVNDLVELVDGVLRMSPRAVVSRIVVTRAGAGLGA